MPPAARMGDQTAHGGTIAAGFPTVLIGGQPAARVTDMHACPMVTPGVPPVPHVGGPISGPGSPTVLIGGLPAARMGDMCVCTGPPDSIVKGLPTVMIA
ncbi:MAG: type VI secretion protein [Chloroflexi bacterium]|nr:type VI secretion protein [Chloroflexota bacterium]